MDLSQSFFELFGLPPKYQLDSALLAERYRDLQRATHPDRYAGASAQEQRLAAQRSAFVNQAFDTLKRPLPRALYLLQLAGWDAERVASRQVAGDFLMEQMRLREQLESAGELVSPGPALERLFERLGDHWRQHDAELREALARQAWDAAASAAVKLQYLDKLRAEAEELEASLLDC